MSVLGEVIAPAAITEGSTDCVLDLFAPRQPSSEARRIVGLLCDLIVYLDILRASRPSNGQIRERFPLDSTRTGRKKQLYAVYGRLRILTRRTFETILLLPHDGVLAGCARCSDAGDL
jgi:hypothetical protein